LPNECGFIIGVEKKKKIPFWTYYICFVVYSGSAQNLPPRPIIKSSIWCLEEKWNSFRSWLPRFRSVVGLTTNHKSTLPNHKSFHRYQFL